MSEDVTTVDYEREKEALRDILSSGEFAAYMEEDAEPGQNLLLRWLGELLEKLSELFPDLEMPQGSQDAVMYVIIGAGLITLLTLSVFLLRLVWVERRMGRRRAVAREDELEQAPLDLAGRSRAAAAAGEYREASRLLFLALLLGFQQRELLRVESWKTNWEYAEALEERNSPWVGLFRASAQRFDTVWYGGRDIGADEYESWRQDVEAVLAETSGAAPEPGRASASEGGAV
ncbi:DUF4129 domain-containing protein [Paenibacillus sp. TRM 82003]|nr:DUF4129 domain-containing protein [Paenibacillus sp. TRM 82003]